MFTIYGLYEVGKPYEIQYVGCTKQTLEARLAEHLNQSRIRHCPVNRWVALTTIECRALQQTKHKTYALELEKRWIAHYARQGHLLNVVDNPKVRRRRAGQPLKPQPEDLNFGNESVKNFLSYLRNLPM